MQIEQSDVCSCLFSKHVLHCCSVLWSSYAPHWSKREHLVAAVPFLPSSSPEDLRTTAPPLVPACTAQVVWSMTGLSLKLIVLERTPQVMEGPQLRPNPPYPTTTTESPVGRETTLNNNLTTVSLCQELNSPLTLNMLQHDALKNISTVSTKGDWNQTWIETLSHSRDRSLCGGVSQLQQSHIVGWRGFGGKQHITHNITDSVK